MNTPDPHELDLLLIGAGPSNIALAVAIEEEADHDPGRVLMLEAGDTIAWHPGLMFQEAQSQVSFLKDLATLRNPTSRFTFLNFLHETGRLDDFVNLQTFFPYRREISAYLRWAAEQFRCVQVRYGMRVEAVEPELGADGRIRRWTVRCASGVTFRARRLVYGAGRAPNVPVSFRALREPQVLHASRFLACIGQVDAANVRSVAVVGGAQSSAEVYLECLQRFPQAQVTLLMRAVGLKPYGGSKFTNELYGEPFIDRFHALPPQSREEVLESMRDSNYAGVTPTMLETLFRIHYLQRFDSGTRARIVARCDIIDAHESQGGVRICWADGYSGSEHAERFDLVVLGTGYSNQIPVLLSGVVRVLDGAGPSVTRDYRVDLPTSADCSLHLLGINEATHGISDTLLSVVSARARRVLQDIRRVAPGEPCTAGVRDTALAD